jgi:hypothetical protein
MKFRLISILGTSVGNAGGAKVLEQGDSSGCQHNFEHNDSFVAF